MQKSTDFGTFGAKPELGQLSSLQTLRLDGNNLSGVIPTELSQLANLEELHLYWNKLSGCVPLGLGDVPSNDFAELHLPNCAPPLTPEQRLALHRTALIALYNATDGPNWENSANWLSDAPLDQWHGVATGAHGRVTELDLRDNGLSGAIPPEMVQLSSLQRLDLAGNDLSDCVPSKLWDVPSNDLTILDLPHCASAPAQQPVSDRTALIALYNATDGPNWENSANWLSDAPLDEWFRVNTDINGRVTTLYLNNNNLSGDIPPELGQLSNLRTLWLDGNNLSGDIPPTLGQLANLQTLWLGGNSLSGDIPPELGRLANLIDLTLYWNNLSGTIPPELGRLDNLQKLLLAENNLGGAIPPTLGQLPNLQWLWLDGNNLSGDIPPTLGQLAELEELTLDGNNLSGAIPPELGRLDNLQALTLVGNNLSGCVPSGLRDIPHSDLAELDLPDC